ncbi:MAG: glycerophosphodiester phosphodiesterase [Prochloraceae cyanobacterium]|nr:glycerophosphodiester phosphodiesterase [Prochloraceae cyanobacterium]
MRQLTDNFPIQIAHRGASGFRPEHTLAAYQLAIDLGADFIEPDLVPTSDGILVARHENEISATTNVADRPEFRDRFTTKWIDGSQISGWFVEDFTLAELKSLRAKERLPHIRPNNTKYDLLFTIPTLAEIIDLVKTVEAKTGRKIGIYPETKHPTYFNSLTFFNGSNASLSIEQLLIDTLIAKDFTATNRVFIQSFEVSNLKIDLTDLMGKNSLKLPLIQLIAPHGSPYDFILHKDKRTYRDLITKDGLIEIAAYASGIGIAKELIFELSQNKTQSQTSNLIENAHEAGLLVHVWTLRNEDIFLSDRYKGNPGAEKSELIKLGIDGYFTDFPAKISNY